MGISFGAATAARRARWLLERLAVVGLALGAAGCDLTVEDENGNEQCLDDFLHSVGSDRARVEQEAASRGIEASKVLEEAFSKSVGFVDVLVDCTASEALAGVASGTGGKHHKVQSPNTGMDKVSEDTAVLTGDSVDLVFLVDTTGSMANSIDTVRRRLASILETLDGKDVRVAMAFYRDKNVDTPWYFRNSSGLVAASTDEVPDFLQTAEASGGGDFAESLYDGLYRTVDELDWQADARMIVAITDAPPLTGSKTDHDQAAVVAACEADQVQVVTVQVSLF